MMPSFSGAVVRFVRKATLCLELFYYAVHIVYFLFVNLSLCPVFFLSLSVLRCGQYRELTPCIRKYSRIYGHVERKSAYVILFRNHLPMF